MTAPRLPRAPHPPRQQHGAALMIMLIIMVIGSATIFFLSFNNTSLHIARDQVTADALAKAKDALIGYAAKDPNRPGELPCPDFNDDGMSLPADDFTGSNCKSLIGRLPWKTLGLPDLRDSSGERLWYAVSNTFHANGSAILYSDTNGDLNISGSQTANNVIAIVFAPGSVLASQNQDRSSTPISCATTTGIANPIAANWCATNYLELNNSKLSTAATPNTGYQTATLSDTFNDQLITITHDQLFTPVEMRIAREVRNCLDAYAVTSSNKYPWAAPLTSYTGQQDTQFGRVSDTPNTDVPGSSVPINASNDPNYSAINNALNSLSAAMSNCAVSDTAANIAALASAAQALLTATASLPNPPYTSTFTAQAAALYGQATTANACWNIEAPNNPGFASNINATLNATTTTLAGLTTTGTSTAATGMSTVWPNGCFANTTTPGATLNKYWSTWKSHVFYQVDDQYKPGNTTPGTPSITVNGTGAYRAAVLVARQAFGAQTRPSTISPPTSYLEGINPHTGTTPATTFETYSPSDTANFSNINDLVLCVDGGNNAGAGGNCK